MWPQGILGESVCILVTAKGGVRATMGRPAGGLRVVLAIHPATATPLRFCRAFAEFATRSSGISLASKSARAETRIGRAHPLKGPAGSAQCYPGSHPRRRRQRWAGWQASTAEPTVWLQVDRVGQHRQLLASGLDLAEIQIDYQQLGFRTGPGNNAS